MAEQWGDRIATVADVLDAHRWKTMGVASVECECGEILYGDESLTQFPADEAFRSHLARAVLALFPEWRCTPSGDEIRNVLHDAMCGDRCEPHAMRLHARMGRAVMALYGDQPTVAQAKADALREAAMDWTDFDAAAMGTPAAWFRARAAAIEKGAHDG